MRKNQEVLTPKAPTTGTAAAAGEHREQKPHPERMSRTSEENFLHLLRGIPNRYGVLTHVFYSVLWVGGYLLRSNLRHYCAQNRLELYFQRALQVLSGVLGDPEADEPAARAAIRRVVRRNMAEEVGHMEMWYDFTAAVGLTKRDIGDVPLSPTTVAALDTFLRLAADENPWVGVGALYAFEAQMPAISATKLQALLQHYAEMVVRNGSDPLRYYVEHQAADQRHAAWWLDLLGGHCTALQDRKAALRGAREMCCAMLDLIDGIYVDAGLIPFVQRLVAANGAGTAASQVGIVASIDTRTGTERVTFAGFVHTPATGRTVDTASDDGPTPAAHTPDDHHIVATASDDDAAPSASAVARG